MNHKRLLIAVGAAGMLAAGLVVADVQLRYAASIGDRPEFLPGGDTALILGASIKSDGTPSDALRDRLDTGIALYRAGRVKRIRLTGDDGRYHTDEIDVMKPYVLAQGVPEADVTTDGQGYRTYESCKNSGRDGLKSIVVVTQRFHLGRALYLCNTFGLDAAGVAADKRTYSDIIYFWARDLAASLKAWWDVNVWAPKPPVDMATD